MERTFSYAMACAWTLVTTLFLLVVVQLSVLLRPASATDLVQLGACEALVYVLGCFGLLQTHAKELPGSRALALRATHPALLAFGLALGLALHAPAETLERVVEHFYPTPELELIRRATMFDTGGGIKAALFVMMATCVVPLVEELFFRGAVYSALRRSNPMLGAGGLTAICFVVGHPDTRAWPALFLISGAITFLRAWSGSLLPALALHVGFNSVTLAAVMTGTSSVTSPVPLPVHVIVAGWILSLGLLLAVHYVARTSPAAASARAEDEDAA